MSRSLRKSTIPANAIIALAQTTIPDGWTGESIGSPLKNVPNASTNPGTTYTGSHQHDPSASHTHAAVNIAHKHTACTNSAGSSTVNIYVNTGTPTISTGLHRHLIYTNDTAVTHAQSSAGGVHQHDATVVDTAWYAYTHIRKGSARSMRQYNNIPFNGVIFTAATTTGYTLDTTGSGRVVTECTYNTTGGTTSHTHGSVGTHEHNTCMATHLHAISGSTDTGTSGANTNSEQASVARTPSHTHTVSGNTSATTATVNVDLVATDTHSETTVTHEPAHVLLGAMKRTTIGIRHIGVPSSSIIIWRCTLASIPTGFALADGSGGTPNYLDKFIKIGANTGELGNTGGSHSHQHASQSHTHAHSGGEHSHVVDLTASTFTATVTSPGVSTGTNYTNNINTTHNHVVTSTNTSIFNGSCNTAGYSGDSASASHQHTASTTYPKSVTVAFIQKT